MLFLDRLDHEIASAKRQQQTFALLYLDLDQFERINDNFGHHTGDLLLKSVAETLRGCIRASDTASRSNSEESDTLIARLGGDEFIILLSNIKIDRSFVMSCTMQKTNLIIIKAIIAMGQSLGMKIVAEGIETEEHYNIMKSYGAHEGQGFFFAPPVSEEEFGKLLSQGVL